MGLIRQWANVRIINDQTFTNPRVDIGLLWPIEWNLKQIDEKKEGELVDEKGEEAEEKEPEVWPLSPKRPREDEETEERCTSPRHGQEASPSSVEGRLDRDDPPSDPRPSRSKDDCECPRCRRHKQWWLGVIGE